ncbi:hypothetical protein [Streptomyces sp. NBC_00525]|uniref:hypothetical protein n=1 Tax=Streptomyces sp. NBC_00525 TaxID=2903660 RepID=UPI002E820D43|nr:hypothetical protein [Streptomyces sp. NBC_00525]WUC95163.1 hypothetical protein OG710_16920 [Streptomyces sp. NBC_00525]
MSYSKRPRAALRLRATALVTLPLLALAAACGDDGSGTRAENGTTSVADVPDPAPAKSPDTSAAPRQAGKSAYYDAQLKYVQCMRGKGGYKDFPDPKLSGYLDWNKIEDVVERTGEGEAYKGGKDGVCFPEMQAAMDLAPEVDQQKAYESMLAHAKCMRDNGVSRFTNPTMSGGNAVPGGDPNPASPVLDSDSPAYEKAKEACQSKLIDAVEGMQ